MDQNQEFYMLVDEILQHDSVMDYAMETYGLNEFDLVDLTNTEIAHKCALIEISNYFM